MTGTTKADLPDPTTARPDNPCAPGPGEPATATDLTWLMNVAAARLRIEFDQIARAAGLGDAREWVVLTALADGRSRTQLELGRIISVDKTTLMAILDRMEQRGLIVRTADPSDRRVRIPQATPAGLKLQRAIAAQRDAHEADLLADVSPADQDRLREILARLAARC
jgi:DNA-binding MarR family transcriptional regulator